MRIRIKKALSVLLVLIMVFSTFSVVSAEEKSVVIKKVAAYVPLYLDEGKVSDKWDRILKKLDQEDDGILDLGEQDAIVLPMDDQDSYLGEMKQNNFEMKLKKVNNNYYLTLILKDGLMNIFGKSTYVTIDKDCIATFSKSDLDIPYECQSADVGNGMSTYKFNLGTKNELLHEHNLVMKYDDTYHWQECAIEDCPQKGQKTHEGKHYFHYENKNNEVIKYCFNECGYSKSYVPSEVEYELSAQKCKTYIDGKEVHQAKAGQEVTVKFDEGQKSCFIDWFNHETNADQFVEPHSYFDGGITFIMPANNTEVYGLNPVPQINSSLTRKSKTEYVVDNVIVPKGYKLYAVAELQSTLDSMRYSDGDTFYGYMKIISSINEVGEDVGFESEYEEIIEIQPGEAFSFNNGVAESGISLCLVNEENIYGDEEYAVIVPDALDVYKNPQIGETAGIQSDLQVNKTNLIKKADLTTKQQKYIEKGAYLGDPELTVSYISDEQINDSVKEKINNVVTNEISDQAKLGQYLDLSFEAKVYKSKEDSAGVANITELNNEATVSVKCPEELIDETKETRNYSVVRVHDGNVDVLDSQLKDGYISFKTDKFSTYAIVYNDESKDNNPKPDDSDSKPNNPDSKPADDKELDDKTSVLNELKFTLKTDVNNAIQQALKENQLSLKQKEALENGEAIVEADLKVKIIDVNTIDSSKKDKILNELKKISNKAVLGQYLDITYYLTIKNKDGEQIGDTVSVSKPGKAVVSFECPNELINNDQTKERKYYIIREHEGQITIIPAKLVDGYIQFDTDQFSTYALAYEDVQKSNGAKVDVKTGDNTNITYYALLATIAILGVAILLKKELTKK